MTHHFDLLVQTARQQRGPQRLLFVFADAELPEDADEAQRAGFEAGQGGALAPGACVDKSVAELSTFEALAEESRRTALPWRVMFVAALAGVDGQPPSRARIDTALEAMVENVRRGNFGGYMALDPDGQPVLFD